MTGDDLLVGVDVDENIDGNNESVTGILSTDYFDLPLVLRIGISDKIKLGLRNTLVLSLDAVSPNDNANYINFGGKIVIGWSRFCLRGELFFSMMKANFVSEWE